MSVSAPIGGVHAAPTAMNHDEINSAVKEFILKNPEVIIESIELMQKRKVKDMEDRINNAIKEKRSEIEDSSHSPYIGSKDSDVTVVMFYDYGCGYCKKANSIVNQLIDSDHNVKVIYKPLPILGEVSEYMTKLILAVYNLAPEKFKVVHEGMMALKNPGKEEIKAVILAHGLNFEDLEIEISKPEVTTMYNKILTLASELRIHGAPVFIINGDFYSGLLELDNMKKIIADLRTLKPSSQSKDPVSSPASGE
ncbi:MAG: DsbA family protein [Pseudomonadota bacterium]